PNGGRDQVSCGALAENERENHGPYGVRLSRRRSSVRRRNRALRKTGAPQRPTARRHLPAVQDFVSVSKTQSRKKRAPSRRRGYRPLLVFHRLSLSETHPIRAIRR